MFEKQFDLRYFDMGPDGNASPATILMLLEETAADHCLAIEYSLYQLLEKGIGWVLLSGRMIMERYPKYKEKITIRTWLSSFKTIRGVRENIIFGEKGEVIGRAKGLWLFFDIKKRKPIKVFDEILKRWSINTNESIDDSEVKIKVLDSAIYNKEFSIHRFDMDSNKHVNNLRYFQWAMESIPDEIINDCYLHTIDGKFIGEAKFGQRIESLVEPEDKDSTFLHTIRDISSKQIYSVARTVWKKRSQ